MGPRVTEKDHLKQKVSIRLYDDPYGMLSYEARSGPGPHHNWPHRKACPRNYVKRHNSVVRLPRGVLAILQSVALPVPGCNELQRCQWQL